jgi:ADP-ribose pyrophosphatase YjhB (NUDIX family)
MPDQGTHAETRAGFDSEGFRAVSNKTLRFCTQCGTSLAAHRLKQDDRERLVCTACGEIHYQNPRILVTCMVTWRNKLLMTQRTTSPKRGLWAPPSGFMEENETLEQGAAREVREETGVVLDERTMHLHLVSSIPRISEVYVGFRASVKSPAIRLGPEALDAGFFAAESMPWRNLAFNETEPYLRLFFYESMSKQFGIHLIRIDNSGGRMRKYRVRTAAHSLKKELKRAHIR